jgi:LPS-assembly lipoprotein
MWWRKKSPAPRHALRLAVVLAAAATAAACFQPLYGDRTVSGGPGLKTAMSGVDVSQVAVSNPNLENRLAVELRNALVFETTGGGAAQAPAHRLNIRLRSTRTTTSVDITTARTEIENYGINASYELVDLKTGKTVIKDQTFSRVAFDIPGQQQRFARQRALRDAEDRAVGGIAQQIKTRLASYFVAGT